jgi:hypothetical protein
MSESCDQEMGSMSIADNTQEPSGDNKIQDSSVNVEVSNLQIKDNLILKVKFVTFWKFIKVLIFMHCLQISYSGTKDPEQVVDDGVYDDYTMDEVDMNIENYEEMFCLGCNDPKHLFAKDYYWTYNPWFSKAFLRREAHRGLRKTHQGRENASGAWGGASCASGSKLGLQGAYM